MLVYSACDCKNLDNHHIQENWINYSSSRIIYIFVVCKFLFIQDICTNYQRNQILYSSWLFCNDDIIKYGMFSNGVYLKLYIEIAYLKKLIVSCMAYDITNQGLIFWWYVCLQMMIFYFENQVHMPATLLYSVVMEKTPLCDWYDFWSDHKIKITGSPMWNTLPNL